MTNSSFDFYEKKDFFVDLDDTLINTSEANKLGLRRAYKKLAAECHGELSGAIPFGDFQKKLKKIYRETKGPDGERKYFDYEPAIFEDYCNYELPGTRITFRHQNYSLAAKLAQRFKDTKRNALMANRYAFEIMKRLKNLGTVYCMTEGNCNYQHTKLMETDLEDLFEETVVTEKKEKELRQYITGNGIDTKTSVIIGDSPRDIDAGKNAGIDTVRVLTGDHKDEPSKEPATATYESLERLLEDIPEFGSKAKNVKK